MSIRIGINGFGRMGRLALRAGWRRPDLEFVHINEIAGDAETAAHLLTFDSAHGRWGRVVEGDGSQFSIDGTPLTFTAIAKPGEAPWCTQGVDGVLECTGKFRTPEQLNAYFDAGVKTVIVDAPHKDLRRARASSQSLIPTSTGSATAIGLIYPDLLGKLTGLAIRVPLLNASLTDCVFEVQRPTDVEEINGAFKRAADGALAGILGYEERPLVSVDYKDDPRSAIIDGLSTMVVDGTCVKVRRGTTMRSAA